MTNPQGPPHDDPSIWARPDRPESEDAATGTPSPPEPPAGQIGHGYHQPHVEHRQGAPFSHNYPAAPPTDPAGQRPSEDTTAPVKTTRRLLRDPVSIILVVVIVVALLAAGVTAAELYARHRADDVVAAAAECVVQDKVSVSFGPLPFLLQHITGNYRDISIHTAGNQIRAAKGMKADIEIQNVDLHGTADSRGTIGALDATATWSSEGIKETVQNALPVVGSFVNSVTTNPADGTIELQGALGLGSVTVKPQAADNGLSLSVVKVTTMGLTVPTETVQSALDVFASRLTTGYPLGIRADSVQVTDSGVTAHLLTRNAAIPTAQANSCFAKL